MLNLIIASWLTLEGIAYLVPGNFMLAGLLFILAFRELKGVKDHGKNL